LVFPGTGTPFHAGWLGARKGTPPPEILQIPLTPFCKIFNATGHLLVGGSAPNLGGSPWFPLLLEPPFSRYLKSSYRRGFWSVSLLSTATLFYLPNTPVMGTLECLLGWLCVVLFCPMFPLVFLLFSCCSTPDSTLFPLRIQRCFGRCASNTFLFCFFPVAFFLPQTWAPRFRANLESLIEAPSAPRGFFIWAS